MKIFNQYKGLQKEVYVICICTIIDRMGSLIGPMFTLILSTLIGLNAKEIAAWGLIYSIFYFPAGILGGRLADKTNKKLLINICDIASGIIYILCGLLELNAYTIAFYLFGGLLQTIEFPSYSVMIGDITTAKDRDKAMSLKYLCLNLGMVIAPVFGGLLLKEHANLIFIISGVTQLLSLLIFDIYIKETKTTADKDNRYETINEKADFKEILKNNMPVFFFLVVSSVSILCYNQFTYILPLDFSNVYGANGPVYYGTVSSVNCITVVVATSFVTLLIAKLTSLDRIILGELMILAGFICMAFFIRCLPLVYIGCVIFTLGEITDTVNSMPYCMNRIPANYRGRISALREVLVTAIESLGNLGIGKIYDNSSNAAWITVVGLSLLTTAGFLVIRRFDRKKYPDLYNN